MVIECDSWNLIDVAGFEDDDFILSLLQEARSHIECNLWASTPVLTDVDSVDPDNTALEACWVEVCVSNLINVEVCPVEGWLVNW